MADGDDYCDLAVAYWYFQETETKRKTQESRFLADMINRRDELGEYHRLRHELHHDPERFQRYFRMSTSQLLFLIPLIGPEIAKLDTNWR